ncbi:MAG TPA: DUF433 domain-containing protein [Saprospiraceae bacterium]|jgi:uncharacterized protein (DUF433 family)|nr:DUF433 domain-containing protein [Saprospiraceae bacterium]
MLSSNVSNSINMKNYREIITIHPDIRFGKPCIRNTRITVGDVLGWLAAGMSYEEILEDFPELSLEAIRAALAFAADREESVKILAAS